MNRGGRGPRRPFYRYPNPGYGYNDGGYNFSSDVNVDNTGGAFVFGTGPPPMHYQQPHFGGGGNYGQPHYGFRGGHYPPPQFGFGQRGFRPPNFRGGRFPRHGYRGGWGPRPQRPRNSDGDEPYYHLSMFEDPWRFLLPQEKQDEVAPTAEETSKSKEAKEENTEEGGTDTGNVVAEVKEDRTVCAEEVTKAGTETEVEKPGGKEASECDDGVGTGSNGTVSVSEGENSKEIPTSA